MAYVEARAKGRCQAIHVLDDRGVGLHAPTCTGQGQQCDHVEAGDNHHVTNLQWLSTPCHAAKTERERAKGYAQRQARLNPSLEASPGMAKRDRK